VCATVGRPPCHRRNGSILARLFHAENALASRPRRLSIRQAVTPEANAATIGSGQPFDRAGSVPPDSGKPSAPVSNPANIETPPPSEAGNRSTVANIERAAQPFAPKTPLQAVATVRRLSVRHHRPRRRKRPACQRFRPMSANAAPPVRCKSNSAALFFTLAAPPDSGKRPPPSASRAGSVRACLSGKPSAVRPWRTSNTPRRRKRTRRHHRKRATVRPWRTSNAGNRSTVRPMSAGKDSGDRAPPEASGLSAVRRRVSDSRVFKAHKALSNFAPRRGDRSGIVSRMFAAVENSRRFKDIQGS